MQENPPERRRARLYKRIELVLETLLWRFRLIAIVPVVMSLASTLLTFAVGTRDIIKSIKFFIHAPESEKSANIALASVVSGIDFYLARITFTAVAGIAAAGTRAAQKEGQNTQSTTCCRAARSDRWCRPIRWRSPARRRG